MKKSPIERFMSHVIAEGFFTHWLWDGALSSKGYGSVRVTGAAGLSNGSAVCVHRRAWELFVGPVPFGLEIDHWCEVYNCVNPIHLQAITPELNNRYRNHGRVELCYIQPWLEPAFALLERKRAA